jgi:transcriptional regulator with XRE-family HTH domain
MDPQKRKALEAAGYRFTDAATFLEMTEEERAVLEARLALAKACRLQRQARKLTQKQLAERIGSSQPRVAKLEQAAPDVTFDLLFKALAALGVRVSVRDCRPDTGELAAEPASGKETPRRKPSTPPGTSDVKIELVGTDS